MINIKEQHVIQFLKERRQLLKKELEKIDNALKVIESSNKILWGGSQTKEIAEELQSNTEKLRAINEITINSKIDEKISYALTKLKSGYKDDILRVLQEEQPELDINKLSNSVGVRLSQLFKNGLIEGERHGRKFQYTLK